ncbi:uncharacterized protein LOC124539123 [Vanessa cardui]|uniref:uncharacterized protein LOC124539123 n=1 Tax=Vanessa cardui TaxID=171605 RepID=UPI001F13D9C4|nr:uncharacterized protein LOC124539123 [Vanessa cardui]
MNTDVPIQSSTTNDEQPNNIINENFDMNILESTHLPPINEQQSYSARESNISNKRMRDVDEAEIWHVVSKSGKRYARSSQNDRIPEEKVEISVTSKEPLPKQFAFARLLKNNNIPNILRVRYINAYKLIIQFENESGLTKLLECQEIKNKGWNLQRTLEVGVSYGTIKNVELDLSETDILESITSSAELIAVKRLNRRDSNGIQGWTPSETIRLCFKGSSLPAYVHVYGVRTKIETYTFPVTQCSFCWRFGHPRKVCPRKKQVCVKCTKDHENCETTEINFVCVNCRGNHMSLSLDCPIRVKEKKIREIMAEFNCAYKRALTMYVPPNSPSPQEFNTEVQEDRQDICDNMNTSPKISTSYASVTASKLTRKQQDAPVSKKQSTKSNNKRRHKDEDDDDINWSEVINQVPDTESLEENSTRNMNSKTHKREESHISFYELLRRIGNTILNKNSTIHEKFNEVLKMCCKWLYDFVANFIPDLNFIKNIFNNNS